MNWQESSQAWNGQSLQSFWLYHSRVVPEDSGCPPWATLSSDDVIPELIEVFADHPKALHLRNHSILVLECGPRGDCD